ncbi:putative membrane protein, putative pseudogen [Corynebacterium kutscheri]|uniref:Membrane protein, putative pseudogen n=1 Tax=Corynebacterium kutscheri TaxID=35755 RepID=A0AB38VX63_9CORY|nr:DUF1542 domain-containing protein [Corynebacterium kutscheri]VEH06651.1 putative membrane protein, putative pseudogen [Corynebacterium kutscheri]VEH82583.1 putative membrane protein, putative pseudogen [Corynebacterium kutscheri]
MSALLLIGIVVLGLVFIASRANKTGTSQHAINNHEDAIADARRWIDRLGSQVLTITGTDTASSQAIADASERFNAASAQISTATTVRQAELARESALEGLHYINAAREIMGLPAGPELPPLEGQRQAGKVTETRTISQDGNTLTVSPVATEATPNYYPGGIVAGRPVPAGWYSRPWWAEAMSTGLWTAGSVLLFSSLFSGMSGVGYSANAWQAGYAEGLADAGGADALGASDITDAGGDASDGGFFDFGGDGGGFFGGDGGLFDGGFDFDF